MNKYVENFLIKFERIIKMTVFILAIPYLLLVATLFFYITWFAYLVIAIAFLGFKF